MMSTALMIETDKQTISRSGAPGRDGVETTTFAQSFGDQVDLSATMKTNGHASDGGNESRTENSSDPFNNVKGPQAVTEAENGKVTAGDLKATVAQFADPTATLSMGTTGTVPVESISVVSKSSLADERSKAVHQAVSAGSAEGSANVLPWATTSKVVGDALDKEPLKGDTYGVTETSSVTPEARSLTSTVDLNPVGKSAAVLDESGALLRSPGESKPIAGMQIVVSGVSPGATRTKESTRTQTTKNESVKKSRSAGGMENPAMAVGERGITETKPLVTSPTTASGQVIAQSSKVDATAPETFPDNIGRPVTPAVMLVSKLQEDTGTGTAGMAGNYTTEPAAGNHPEANPIVASGSAAEISKTPTGSASGDKDRNRETIGVSEGASSIGTRMEIGGVAGVLPGTGAAHAGMSGGAARLPTAELNAHTAGLQMGLEENIGSGAGLDGSAMSHRTLLATPTALEVGVPNSTEGWLKIRVEMDSGGAVNASLSSATSAGQEMLHRDLPALTAYLQQERIEVAAVVVHANAEVRAELRQGGDIDQRGQEAPQQNRGQQDDGDSSGGGFAYPGKPEDGLTTAKLSGAGGAELLSIKSYAGGGSWLNVRA